MAETKKLFCGRPFKGKFDGQEIISLTCDDLNKLHANLNADTGKVHLVVNTNQKGVRYTEIDLWYRQNGREKKEESKKEDTRYNNPGQQSYGSANKSQKPASPPVSRYSEADHPPVDEDDIPF